MFILLIVAIIFCFVFENDVKCKLVEGYITFIVYDIYDYWLYIYIIKKQINKQISK